MATCKMFNDHAELFLKRMHETFPHEKKIMIYRAKFDALSMVNPKKPVEMFMESMIPFGVQILTKDEQFFKQKHFVEKAQSMSEKMGLTEYWDTSKPETKESIWEFTQGLYIIGMGCLGYQKELQELMTRTGFQG